MKSAKIRAILAIIALMLSGLGAGVAIYEATRED